MNREDFAPGWPGIPARWTSSAKVGVGAARDARSRVTFTLSHGILNEIYFPRVDQACTRDMGFVVTDGAAFFSEEKRHAVHEIVWLAPGVPGFRLVNRCVDGRYRLEKEVIADPMRDVVRQRITFEALDGGLTHFHLYALLAPHLGNYGAGNTAWVGDWRGVPMLFAERAGRSLAMACSAPWLARSVGFVGASDGWQDLTRNGHLTRVYARAENGNLGLTGEIDLSRTGGRFEVVIAFGNTIAEAGHHALASLQEGFEPAVEAYRRAWEEWQSQLLPLDHPRPRQTDLYRASTAVLATHEAQAIPGGMIASLSIPWGFARGDDDLGGYHLVWPRDLVEMAGGWLAAGASDEARRVLSYLRATQEADGCWAQNMWLDGTSYWSGVQMDETALPILVVDLARRCGVLDTIALESFWPMVRRAAGFIVRNGPVTQQDRWEEDAGYSPFTLAAQIAALLAAADLASLADEPDVAGYLRETADTWNARVERWTFVTDTDLAQQVGVSGYYVRIAPPDSGEAATPLQGYVPIKNRPPDQATAPAIHIVSPDALALVRFGLRAPHDPRILDTVKVLDALLKVELPYGPAWHRYNEDGYGEHDDGAPFDGTGKGRLWPLLTGERAHYELAGGATTRAEELLAAMERSASDGGLLPEQCWDQPDLAAQELFLGRPSGSAMPLVWAHAEYIKLRRSLRDRRVFDMPPQTAQRYVLEKRGSLHTPWRFNHKIGSLAVGSALRVETLAPAIVHWSVDGWQTIRDSPTRPSGLGVHLADLPTTSLRDESAVDFTFYWPEADRWEGVDFRVTAREHEAYPAVVQKYSAVAL